MATDPQLPVATRDDIGSVTILSGASLSDAVALSGRKVSAIIMPAGWTSADISFEASYDGSTFNDMHFFDAGITDTEVVIPTGADRHITVNPVAWVGMKHLKVRSGTSGTPVNQGADRAIQIVLTNLYT